MSKSLHINNNNSPDEIDENSPQKSALDKSVNSCLICFDKPPDAVFMDCGHGGYINNNGIYFNFIFEGVCYECAVELFKATTECYLCRMVNLLSFIIKIKIIVKEIKQVLQIDLNAKGEFIRVVGATQVDQGSEKSQ